MLQLMLLRVLRCVQPGVMIWRLRRARRRKGGGWRSGVEDRLRVGGEAFEALLGDDKSESEIRVPDAKQHYNDDDADAKQVTVQIEDHEVDGTEKACK